MEKRILFETRGHDVIFDCDSRWTRSGFAHDCRMYIDLGFRGEGHAYYLNRTWEAYPFQSVCMSCVDELIGDRIAILRYEYRTKNNISRITAKRKKEVDTIIDLDDEVILLRTIKVLLRDKDF